MDTYENNIPQEEAVQIPQVEVTEEAPKRKKVSPFEDSPYIAYAAPQQINRPSKPKKERKLWKPLAAFFLAACLVVVTCAITVDMVNSKWENRIEEMEEQFGAKVAGLEEKINQPGEVVLMPGNAEGSTEGLFTPGQVYAANVKSVVMIYNKVSSQGGMSVSTGSGFIITADGYVVTNQHVIDGNGSITVITTDGTEYPAQLVGADDANDVALLKVEAENLQVFADTTTYQNLEMIPLAELPLNWDQTVIYNTPPQNL